MSYFKIPITKLTEKIKDPIYPDISIELNESQLGMLQGLEDHRFWVHISARRTGKSYAASILALAKLLEPSQQVMVVAPNYNLSSIIWEYVIGFITRLGLKTVRRNNKDRIFQLENGSTFRLLSASNRDSLVGRAANLLIVDEAAVIDDDEYFTRDLRPVLSTFPDSRCLFITTPRGKANYIYEYFMRGNDPDFPDWGSDLFTCRSNPRLADADIEEAKSTLPENEFLQEYYCKWTVFEGQIYRLQEDIHLKNLSDICSLDNRFDFIAGLDIGYRDQTAFIVIATDGEYYYIVDEYIDVQRTTAQHAEIISEKIKYWGIDSIYIDSAAAQARADLAYEYEIYCEKAIKSVNDGISSVQTLVEQEKIFFSEDNAQQSFKNMSAYRWNPRTETQKPIHDINSHCSDAIRYAIYTHSKTMISIFAA